MTLRSAAGLVCIPKPDLRERQLLADNSLLQSRVRRGREVAEARSARLSLGAAYLPFDAAKRASPQLFKTRRNLNTK